MSTTTRKRGAPAGARAGARDEGYEGRTSVSGVYADPLTAASAPRRVAVYARGRQTMDLPLPNGLMARPEIEHQGKLWRLLKVLTLLAGETIEDAIAREIAQVDSRIAPLEVAALVGRDG